MKLNRLIGIINELQQKKFVTAPYLADKFEVSRRTINRDIEDMTNRRFMKIALIGLIIKAVLFITKSNFIIITKL